MLKKVVEFVVMELVEHSSSVRILQEEQDSKLTLSIHVHEQDLGKVIGKGGETIRAIRSLVIALNSDKQREVFVDIVK